MWSVVEDVNYVSVGTVDLAVAGTSEEDEVVPL